MEPENSISFLEDRVGFLTRVDIFSEVSPSALEHLASVMQETKFIRQESIVKKGQDGDTMYIITRGEVRVHDRGFVLCRMGEGEVFGEYSLFDEEKRSASVTAERVTYALVLSRKDFDAVCDRYPEIYKGVILRLVRKMRERNVLEEKLTKSYIKVQKQKNDYEDQNDHMQKYKKLLEQQNFDLHAMNDEKNELIGVVVHGLKNPLTSSKCITEMLLDDEAICGDHKESLEIVHGALRRMNQMINQILNINAIESKVYRPKVERFLVKNVVNQILCHFKQNLDSKEIQLEDDIQDVFVNLNKVYFSQIVDNLISNAIEMTPEQGSISLSIHENDDSIILDLKDGGQNQKILDTNALFRKYKRQKQKISAFVDSEGLSLSIVKKYVDAMNGLIEVIPLTGGTHFRITFKK